MYGTENSHCIYPWDSMDPKRWICLLVIFVSEVPKVQPVGSRSAFPSRWGWMEAVSVAEL